MTIRKKKKTISKNWISISPVMKEALKIWKDRVLRMTTMIQVRLFINRIQRRNLARVSKELWVEVTMIKRCWGNKDINRIAIFRCLDLQIIIGKATSLDIKGIRAIKTSVIMVPTLIILLKDLKCKAFLDLMLEEEVAHLSPRKRPSTINSQLKL